MSDLPSSDRNSSNLSGDEESPDSMSAAIVGKNIAFVGQLGSMNRREARNLLRSYGAKIANLDSRSLDWVVIGADEPPLAEADLLSPTLLAAARSGDLQILDEEELWQGLGWGGATAANCQLYTPAMLADLLNVSVRVIRRWHRRGLITPVQTVHRLPYFDFQEVAIARRLARWIASGANPKAIEERLVDLVAVRPGTQRPLDQLSILVEGKQVLLRQGEGLLETGGQLRFDFDAAGDTVARQKPSNPSVEAPPSNKRSPSNKNSPGKEGSHSRDGTSSSYDLHHQSKTTSAGQSDLDSAELSMPDVLPFPSPNPIVTRQNQQLDPVEDHLLNAVYAAEDADDLDSAVDWCHAILARDGARADINFQLAELLYRNGQLIAARERYYMAVELDPEFPEARASLANVLAEAGQFQLAIAAYQGALSLYPGYVEAHFGLANVLDRLGEPQQAIEHWHLVMQLAPNSPWAQEAKLRLSLADC